MRSLNDNKGILRANNTHMRPQVAQRRRLGVFVCLCVRFLWTTMDSVMLRPCEVANSLPIPLAAAGAPRIWENLGEPAPLDAEDPWGPEVLTPFADSADFTSLSGPQLSLVSNMLLLGDTKQAWSLESSISLCRFRYITGLAQAGQCSVSGCGAIAVLIRARFLR